MHAQLDNKHLPPSLLMDIHAVAEKLGVSVNTVYAWIHQRRIPFIKVGRLVKFDERDIDKWIGEQKVEVFEHK